MRKGDIFHFPETEDCFEYKIRILREIKQPFDTIPSNWMVYELNGDRRGAWKEPSVRIIYNAEKAEE